MYFKVLDFVWGNGENPYKLLRSLILLLIGMSLFDVFNYKDPTKVTSYSDAFLKMPEVFLGVTSPTNYPTWYSAIIYFMRLVAMGFFMSIIIKRFNRR